MRELLAAIVVAGITFVVLAIVVKTIAVAIVGAAVMFIIVGFGPRMLPGRKTRTPRPDR